MSKTSSKNNDDTTIGVVSIVCFVVVSRWSTLLLKLILELDLLFLLHVWYRVSVADFRKAYQTRQLLSPDAERQLQWSETSKNKRSFSIFYIVHFQIPSLDAVDYISQKSPKTVQTPNSLYKHNNIRRLCPKRDMR